MVGLATLGPTGQAAATVGVVLVEAAVLYVVYGGLTRLAAPLVGGADGVDER